MAAVCVAEKFSAASSRRAFASRIPARACAPDGSVNSQSSYTYAANGQIASKTDGSGTTQYSYDAEGRRITETQGIYPNATTTDLYYSNEDQVVQENVGSLVTAEHVWSPFYVDALVQTVNNPTVTSGQSNGSVDSSFGKNSSNQTTTTLSSAVSFAQALSGLLRKPESSG